MPTATAPGDASPIKAHGADGASARATTGLARISNFAAVRGKRQAWRLPAPSASGPARRPRPRRRRDVPAERHDRGAAQSRRRRRRRRSGARQRTSPGSRPLARAGPGPRRRPVTAARPGRGGSAALRACPAGARRRLARVCRELGHAHVAGLRLGRVEACDQLLRAAAPSASESWGVRPGGRRTRGRVLGSPLQPVQARSSRTAHGHRGRGGRFAPADRLRTR